MLRIIAQRVGHCKWFGHLRMDKVSVTPLLPRATKPGLLKLSDYFPTLGGTRQLFFYVA